MVSNVQKYFLGSNRSRRPYVRWNAYATPSDHSSASGSYRRLKPFAMSSLEVNPSDFCRLYKAVMCHPLFRQLVKIGTDGAKAAPQAKSIPICLTTSRTDTIDKSCESVPCRNPALAVPRPQPKPNIISDTCSESRGSKSYSRS